MDKENNANEKERNKNTSHFLKLYRQINRRTRYIVYERNRDKTVLFDERYTRDVSKSAVIEDVIKARNLHIALNKALAELPPHEYQIISECFFESNKPNLTKLSEKHGITRQVYTRKRDRILVKLRRLVISHYEEI